MKNIITYIEEKLTLTKNTGDHPKIIVETKNELKKIIKERIEQNDKELDLTDVDVSKIIDFGRLFEGKNFLVSLDISNWNVSNAITMEAMFNGCYDLKDIDLSKWDVSNVEIMDYMFENCQNFNSDSIKDWNLAKIKSMRSMFHSCISFNQDLSAWDIDRTKTEISNMFAGCSKLKTWPAWYAKK